MKTSNLFKAQLTATLVILTCIASASQAGAKYSGDIHVAVTNNADGSGTATGVIGAIYNASTTTEWIGCQSLSSGQMFCGAVSEPNTVTTSRSGFCTTTSSYLAKSVATLSVDAQLSFSWDTNGRCTSITVKHSSEFDTKY